MSYHKDPEKQLILKKSKLFFFKTVLKIKFIKINS